MKISSRYLPFKKAREYARALGLKSPGEWKKFVKGKLPALGIKPYDIPDSPGKIYGNNGWLECPTGLALRAVGVHSKQLENLRYPSGLKDGTNGVRMYGVFLKEENLNR